MHGFSKQNGGYAYVSKHEQDCLDRFYVCTSRKRWGLKFTYEAYRSLIINGADYDIEFDEFLPTPIERLDAYLRKQNVGIDNFDQYLERIEKRWKIFGTSPH
jgi:hypothetical protein